MKRAMFILICFTAAFFISCNEDQGEEEEFVDPEIENIELDEELITTDFDELEDKMEEIMYESDDSNPKVKKDVAVIKLQGAKVVDVDLNIGAGKLVLSGGASELLTGGFIYTNDKWKPEIKYKVKESKGHLLIEQPDEGEFNLDDDDKYIWNLKFNNKTPLNFDVELGAGLSEIYLSELNLKDFHMVMGVGKTEIDLRGKWKQSAEIHLDGGIGLTQVYLPDNVGIKLEILKGVAGVEVKNLIKKKNKVYVNDIYETSDITLKIYLKTGIGKIEVE